MIEIYSQADVRSVHTNGNKSVILIRPNYAMQYHITFKTLNTRQFNGMQGWRSGESTRLPPMWPGFDSQTRCHKWVEFVGSLLCTERFSPGTPVSPLLKNQHLT